MKRYCLLVGVLAQIQAVPRGEQAEWAHICEAFIQSMKACRSLLQLWLAYFITGRVAPQMLVSIGRSTYLFHGVWCLIASVFSFSFVSEASNGTFEQVAAVLSDSLQADEDSLRCQVQREVWAETNVQPQAPKSPYISSIVI